MEITEVKVFPVQEEKLKAFVSVVFDGCFMVNDIKIIHGREGLFISMPSRKKKNGEFKDVAHPLNNDTRQSIEAQILAEYERVLEERGEHGAGAPPPPRRRPTGARRQRRAASEPPGRTDPTAGPRVPPVEETLHSGAIDLPEAGGHEEGKRGEAAPTPAPSEGSALSPEEDNGPKEPGATTLEEVEERHLRDSFWTVT